MLHDQNHFAVTDITITSYDTPISVNAQLLTTPFCREKCDLASPLVYFASDAPCLESSSFPCTLGTYTIYELGLED